MKRSLVLSLICLFALAVVAFATPTINPWLEVNVPEIIGGSVSPPTLDAGVTLEGWISHSWFIDLGFAYADADLLDKTNERAFGVESNIGFDQLVSVNTTGTLLYGCQFTAACDITYTVAYPYAINLNDLIPSFKALGYVGPLEVWAGMNLPYDSAGPGSFGIQPFFGMRVDFDIRL